MAKRDKIVWHDVTPYKNDMERDAYPVREWVCKVAGILKVRVHKEKGYGNEWLLSCKELGIDKVMISYDDADEAKREALIFLKARLENRSAELTKYAEAIGDEFSINPVPMGVNPEGWAIVPNTKVKHFIRSNGVSLCNKYKGQSSLKKSQRKPRTTDCKVCASKWEHHVKRGECE